MHSVDLTWLPHEPKYYLQVVDGPSTNSWLGNREYFYILGKEYLDELLDYPSFQTYQLLFQHFKKPNEDRHCLIVGVRLWFNDLNDALVFKLSHV